MQARGMALSSWQGWGVIWSSQAVGLSTGRCRHGRPVYLVLLRSTAKQVKLTDVLPAESTLVDGTLDASLGKIAMGSHAKHSYVIVFNTGSIEVTLPDATVTYQAEDESSDLTVSTRLCCWGGWAPGGPPGQTLVPSWPHV